MVKDKGGTNPLVLKLGVAVAISCGAFLYSQFRTRGISLNPSPSPSPSSGDKKCDSGSASMTPTSGDASSILHENIKESSHPKETMNAPPIGITSSKNESGEEDKFIFPEFNDLVREELEAHSKNYNVSPRKDVDRSVTVEISIDKEKEEEIHNLKNMVRDLQDRERNLEKQLREYYGFKDQEGTIRELQNRLKINSMEAKLLTLKIESLHADKKRLEDQVAEQSKLAAELESAKQMISVLKKKQRLEEEHTKEQLSHLQNKVADLQGQERNTEKILLRLKELEAESTEFRLANSRLQYENAELLRRLESTQIHSTSTMEIPEVEALQESNHRLREENDDLKNKIEQIQETRCADVEELVYLRWVNACLRFELRNHKAPSGKTVARDLCNSLSPKSEEKAKQLILEYANSEGAGYEGLLDFDSECWSSSQDSSHTESVEPNDSSVEASYTKRNKSSSKSKFLSKLRKLVNGKDSSAENGSPLSYATTGRRESISTSSFDDTRTYSNNIVAASESRVEECSNKIASHAQSILRPSLDNQRQRALSLDGLHELKGRRRNSDVESPLSYKRVGRSASGLGRDSRSEQDLDSEKLELMKLAQALNVSSASSTTPGSPDSENLELMKMAEVLNRSKVSARPQGRSVYSSF